MSNPFLIFSWNAPFLPAFRGLLLKDAERGAIPLVISRSTWPGQYLRSMYLREAERGGDEPSRLLPRFMTLDEAVESWYAAAHGKAELPAGPLDQVEILYRAVQAAGGEEGRHSLRDLDLAGFFPWGLRLADLLDEMFANLVTPADIPGLEGEVLPYAADLLAKLGNISAFYLSELEKHGMTTPGIMLKRVAEKAGEGIPAPLAPSEERPVYLIGFHTLSAGKDAVLKALWQAGAAVCLHADPALAGGGPVHWVCRRFRTWMEEWHAEAVPAGEPAASPKAKETFFPGFDLHSQLGQLGEDLSERNRRASSAIILPYPRVLMPVLHHLPDVDRPDVNVSLGVPLAEAPVFQLIHALTILQLKRLGTRYHWKELLDVISSPLLSGLTSSGGQPLQPVLERACRAVRTGRRYTDPFTDVATEDHVLFSGREAEVSALREVLEVTVTAFSDADTPEKAGLALTGLMTYVRRHITEEARARASMDMECLYRLQNTIIPALRDSLMAKSQLPLETLALIIDGLMNRQLIFFEPPASRLVLLQIMGVMESLLLDFDSVYIIEATDERLPGVKKHDPILPDSLRSLLGLPDLNAGNVEKGYAIMRLCRSARHVHFYWQEGVRSGMFNERRTRSRFVEEYIWEREKEEKRIFRRGQPPLGLPAVKLTPMGPADRILDLSLNPRVRAEMDALLQRKISPSALDMYVRCPAQFGFYRLSHFTEPDEVNEGDNPSEVGKLLHEVLQIFHERRLGQKLPPAAERGPLKDELLSLFEERLHAPSCLLTSTLPPESLYALTASAGRRLRDYLDRQPDDACPIRLETDFQAPVTVCGRTFTLGGRFDRMDQRGNGLTILDYKTGTIRSFSGKFWKNTEFFDGAENILGKSAPQPEEVTELLEEIRREKASVQLPAYITIARSASRRFISAGDRKTFKIPGEVTDACFVELRDRGEEKSFCDISAGDDAEIRAIREFALPHAHLLPEIVLLSLSMAETLEQRRGLHCMNCPFLTLCQS